MITIDAIRLAVKQNLEEDRNTQTLDAFADTLEAALSGAAIEFDTRVANLEYEVLEIGSPGIATIGKKPWHLRVSKSNNISQKGIKTVDIESVGNAGIDIPEDRDGSFFVRYFNENIMLKVIPSSGKGKAIDLKYVLLTVEQNTNVVKFDRPAIEQCIQTGTDAQYVKVGTRAHDKGSDAQFTLTISDDEMEALITALPPAKNGSEIAIEQVRAACKVQGIVDEADFSPLTDFIDNPVYNEPAVIVRGISPVNGANASIEYLFELDTAKLISKEAERGKVDYKNLNLVQNVEKGKEVAKKIPAEKGKNGLTLLGKQIMATDGIDTAMLPGSNVSVNEDGSRLIADIDGRVFVANGKVSVEQILQLDGVSIKTGNVTFLGTVIVNGNVEDGYDIKASGDIKVSGTIGKSNLEAGGDIIISSGIMGQGLEKIRAGKSIWAKFIQNAIIDAGEYVIVSDGIINSNVTANKKILLNGKRATIIGGRLRAKEEINAKTIGSTDGGSETILEVGFDVKKKIRLDELQNLLAVRNKEMAVLDVNLKTFETIKKAQKVLPAEKQLAYTELMKKKNTLTAELKEITVESKEINALFESSPIFGKISASAVVYPGVKVVVRTARSDIKTEILAVTFFFRNGSVERGRYEGVSPEEAKLMVIK
jgi:uncharacterized protein (DUF342 family)